MTGWILVILVFMVGILAWTSAVKQALLNTSDGALERRQRLRHRVRRGVGDGAVGGGDCGVQLLLGGRLKRTRPGQCWVCLCDVGGEGGWHPRRISLALRLHT